MKGQMSYVMKPLTLVSVVILLVFLIYSLNSFKIREVKAQKALDITNTATNTLLLLANSEDCLAYRDLSTGGAYANIVDVGKLDEFVVKYGEIEPDCARSYDFGWRVKIVEFDNTGGNAVEGRSWGFGSKEFSKDKSFRESVEFWMPVAIKYSDMVVKVGRMELTVVDGELEKVAGFLDYSCNMGKLGKMTSTSTEVKVSYPVTYDSVNNHLCLGGKIKACRKLECRLEGSTGLESAGQYLISARFISPDKLMVSV